MKVTKRPFFVEGDHGGFRRVEPEPSYIKVATVTDVNWVSKWIYDIYAINIEKHILTDAKNLEFLGRKRIPSRNGLPSRHRPSSDRNNHSRRNNLSQRSTQQTSGSGLLVTGS
jgi:hypothetical protein